jgi:hypothetical protein
VLGGTGDDAVLVGVRREFEECVQARGHAGDAYLRGLAVQGGDQPVSAAAVGRPAAAHVPVVVTRRDELGQRQLLERARVPVGQPLGLADLLDEPGRQDEPGQPQARREALARGTGVDERGPAAGSDPQRSDRPG